MNCISYETIHPDTYQLAIKDFIFLIPFFFQAQKRAWYKKKMMSKLVFRLRLKNHCQRNTVQKDL